MKRIGVGILSIFLIFLMAVGTVAEEELNVELLVSESDNIEICDPEIDFEISEATIILDEQEVYNYEAYGDSNLATGVNSSDCDHEMLEPDAYDLKVTVLSCEPINKYQHVKTYTLSGTIRLYCPICRTIVGSNKISPAVKMRITELCSWQWYQGKCAGCGQKATTCTHKKSHSITKIVGCNIPIRGFAWTFPCVYYDSNRHFVETLRPCNIIWPEWEEAEDFITQVYLCDTCGALGVKDVTYGYDEDIGWYCYGDPIGYVNDFDYSVELTNHSYVNGVCTGCGHIKSEDTTVTLAVKNATLGVKEKLNLSAKVKPSSKAKELKYTSSDNKIATVNSKGIVTARKAGKATISAKVGSKVLEKCVITVKKAPGKVTLNKTTSTLTKGKTLQLNMKLPNGTASRIISWSSSNTKVATVSQKGLVKAVNAGEATITVKTFNGKKATCKVTVKKESNTVEISGLYGKTITQAKKKINGLEYWSRKKTIDYMKKQLGYSDERMIDIIPNISDQYKNDYVCLEMDGNRIENVFVEGKPSKYVVCGVKVGMGYKEAKKKVEQFLKGNWDPEESSFYYGKEYISFDYHGIKLGNDDDMYVQVYCENEKVQYVWYGHIHP